MRKDKRIAVSVAALLALGLLSGCSQTGGDDRSSNFEVAEAEALAPNVSGGEADSGVKGGEIAVAVPQIAYVYDYGFRVGSAEIAGLQQRHANMCENLGARQCTILSMNQSGGEGDYANGRLELAVAAERARAFGIELTKAAEGSGGKQISASLTSEELSKQIVDTEARLRARVLLRDRLMEVLATRKGTVAELVEAERGVAQVNEEIDQARSWLEEMRGRVAFSRVNITYESSQPEGGGFFGPIRTAIGSIGAVLGTVIAVLIFLTTIAVPLVLVGWAGRSLSRRLRGRSEAEPTTEDA